MPEEQNMYEQLKELAEAGKDGTLFGTTNQIYSVMKELGYVPRENMFPSYKGGKPLSQKERDELLKDHKEVLEALRKKKHISSDMDYVM
jgi:hypothetical protein